MGTPNSIDPLSLYGTYTKPLAGGIGRTMYVAATANMSEFQRLFPASDGIANVYATRAAALSDCQTGHGDVIYVDPSYVTVATAAELLSAETKGVSIRTLEKQNVPGIHFCDRLTGTLPQTTHSILFTVNGRIRLISIIGTVTTALQALANNTKLQAWDTAASNSTDLCSTADVTGLAAGATLSITGTLANALVTNAATVQAFVYQAASLVLKTGTIDVNCAASATGSVKWHVEYQPLDPGAFVLAA